MSIRLKFMFPTAPSGRHLEHCLGLNGGGFLEGVRVQRGVKRWIDMSS